VDKKLVLDVYTHMISTEVQLHIVVVITKGVVIIALIDVRVWSVRGLEMMERWWSQGKLAVQAASSLSHFCMLQAGGIVATVVVLQAGIIVIIIVTIVPLHAVSGCHCLHHCHTVPLCVGRSTGLGNLDRLQVWVLCGFGCRLRFTNLCQNLHLAMAYPAWV